MAGERLPSDLERRGRWFEAIAAAAQDVIFTFDTSARFTYANRALLELWGKSPEEAYGKSLRELDYPLEVAERMTRQVAQVVETRAALRDECFISSFVEGGAFYEYIFTPVLDRHGNVEAVAGIGRDTTERQRYERRVQESETRYRSLFETMDEGFCVIEVIFDGSDKPVDYRFLEINPVFVRQTGLLDAVGKTVRSLVPGHEEHWFEIYGRVATTGEAVRFRRPARALGDRWYDVHAYRVGAPEQRRVAVLFNDVTDEAKAAAKLQQSEARFRSAFDIETVGVMFFDISGRVLEANDTFLRMCGYSRADLAAGLIRWDVMTPPEWMPPSIVALNELVETGRTTPYEKEYLRKDGSRWWGLFAARRIGDSEGVEFVLDVGERKLTEERQTLLMREIDHRARNMLAMIQAVVNLTANGKSSMTEFVTAVQSRIASMSHTQDLIARSRWQGASMRVLVRDELSPYVADRPDAARIDGEDLVLKPEAAIGLSMVVHELTTNAAKYGALSRPEGRVSVTWRRTDGGAVVIEWDERDGPPVTMPARKGFGSTLITASVAGGIGGSASLNFSPGGVQCSIHLPTEHVLANEAMQRLSPLEPPRWPSAPTQAATILLVEDQPLIALETKVAIEACGYDVTGPAYTLDDALFIARTEPIQAAVLDVNLAGSSVFGVADILLFRHIPFVFVSGYRADSLPERYRQHPILSKPITAPAIGEALRALGCT